MENKDFATYVPFETAINGEYIHTYESLKDCIDNSRIKNVCWLDESGLADEIINCELEITEESFNILVPKELFNYEDFKKWCQINKNKIWIDGRHTRTRGIDYFENSDKE